MGWLKLRRPTYMDISLFILAGALVILMVTFSAIFRDWNDHFALMKPEEAERSQSRHWKEEARQARIQVFETESPEAYVRLNEANAQIEAHDRRYRQLYSYRTDKEWTDIESFKSGFIKFVCFTLVVAFALIAIRVGEYDLY